MAICYQPCNILSPTSVIKKSLPKPSITVRWNSVEGCAMGKRVMVYKFTGWDTVSLRSMSLPVPIWGTADFIIELGGELIDESAIEVDEDDVVEGVYFPPQRESFFCLCCSLFSFFSSVLVFSL